MSVYKVTVVAEVEGDSQEAVQEHMDNLLDDLLVDSYQLTVELEP